MSNKKFYNYNGKIFCIICVQQEGLKFNDALYCLRIPKSTTYNTFKKRQPVEQNVQMTQK